jgi:hypothetical protein
VEAGEVALEDVDPRARQDDRIGAHRQQAAQRADDPQDRRRQQVLETAQCWLVATGAGSDPGP